MKNGKDFSKKGKNKGAGGGEKAGNSKKQSYKQVGIKKKRYVGTVCPIHTCYKQLRKFLIMYVTPLSVLQWRQKVQGSRSVFTKIKQPLQPCC